MSKVISGFPSWMSDILRKPIDPDAGEPGDHSEDKRDQPQHCWHAAGELIMFRSPPTRTYLCCHCGRRFERKYRERKDPEHGYFEPGIELVGDELPEYICPGPPDWALPKQ